MRSKTNRELFGATLKWLMACHYHYDNNQLSNKTWCHKTYVEEEK